MHFDVPRGGAQAMSFLLKEVVGHQRHQRVQSEERRSRSANGSILPLPLGLDGHMGAGFFKGRFHAPAAHEPHLTENFSNMKGDPPQRKEPSMVDNIPRQCEKDCSHESLLKG